MTVVDEKHSSSHIGAVLLGLLAFALAMAAAYLWLSDGVVPAPIRSLMTPQAAGRPPASMLAARPKPVRVVRAPTSVPIPHAIPAETAAPPAPAADSQIAADAAAAGMTSRVRPADSGSPGQ